MRTRSLITDEEFTDERKKLRDELAHLSDNQDESLTTPTTPDLATLATFVFTAHVREWFHAGSPTTKRTILEIVGSNPHLAGRTVSIEAKKPFGVLEARTIPQQPTLEQIEPASGPDSERLFTPSWGLLSSLCRLVEDVRTYFSTEPRSAKLAEQLLAFLEEQGVIQKAA
jgi:hypothetical protein